MTRYDRLLKHGYKVKFIMNKSKGDEGFVHAAKGNHLVRAKSETDAHKKIFGY